MMTRKNKSEKNYLPLFLMIGGIFFITPIFIFPNLIDNTNVPRFFILSLVFIPILFLTKIQTKIKSNINFIFIIYILFYLINVSSCLWSASFSEAIFESQKIFLGLLVFIFTIQYYKINDKFEIYLIRGISLLTLIFIVVAIIQLFLVSSLQLIVLYNISSLCGNKNLFSSFLFLLLPFNILGIIKSEKRIRIFPIIATLCSLFFILLLQTRAVWLALFIATILFVVLASIHNGLFIKKHILKVVILILFLLTSIFIMQSSSGNLKTYFHRFSSTSEGVQERYVLWNKTIQLIKKNPVFGIGTGNWQIYYPSETLSGLENAEFKGITFQRPHNDFLWIGSETGTIGLILILTIYLLIIIKTFKTILKQKNNIELIIYLSAFIGFLIISFFDFPKERTEHLIFSNAVMGILYIKSLQVENKFNISIKIYSFFKFIVFSILIVNLIIGISRMQGESKTNKIIQYKQVNQWNDVLLLSEKTKSIFYTLDPMSMPISWYSGLASFHQKNYQNAVKYLEIAYRENPYNKDVINDLASAYSKNNQLKNTKKYYQEAIRISPKFEMAKINLAIMYANEKNFEKALSLINSIEGNGEKKQFYLKEFGKFAK